MRQMRLTMVFLLCVGVLGACASKPAHTDGDSVKTLNPADLDAQNASRVDRGGEEGVPFPTGGTKATAGGRVTLVIGGIGVASFGTIGVLKKLKEEGIRVDRIVATGWPAIFALGYGFTKSDQVHDLEWFGTRLAEADFIKLARFEPERTRNVSRSVSDWISNNFKRASLGETRIPVAISAYDPYAKDWKVYETGDWKEPLVFSFLLPMLASSVQSDSIPSLKGLDVDAALARGDVVIAVDMYEEYFRSLRSGAGAKAKRANLAIVQKQIAESLARTPIQVKITVGKSPLDFASRRQAILAGYEAGKRIAAEVRQRRAASQPEETAEPAN